MDLDMKIQYKNKTYEQTNWYCCDCELIEWKQGFASYYIDCPSLVKLNCRERGFKQKQFTDKIFNL